MDVHAAAIRSASLCRYLSEAHALGAYGIQNDWRIKTAHEELASVAESLGFSLTPLPAETTEQKDAA